MADGVRKRELEMALERVAPHPAPSAAAEQYATPARIAADVLWFAHGGGDIAGHTIADLGCGTGVLGIGAALLGATSVVGIDADPVAIRVARANARALSASARFRVQDVRAYRGTVDVVLMNPPFGAQTRHADLPFLEAAVRTAPIVYSLHNAATESFVARKLRSLGARPTHRKVYVLPIPHRFAFHREDHRDVAVLFLRSERDAPQRYKRGSRMGSADGARASRPTRTFPARPPG